MTATATPRPRPTALGVVVTANTDTTKGTAMSTTTDTSTAPAVPTDAPTSTSSAASSTGTGYPNARGEAVFLTAETYTLTARQVVLALAAHLARYGDTLHVRVVDPLSAIDAVLRFDGPDLTAWIVGRTPTDVATIRARAEHIARDYFGWQFPAVPW